MQRHNDRKYIAYTNKNYKLERNHDLPAILNFDGTIEWCKADKSYRAIRSNNHILPAVITKQGYKGYYKNKDLRIRDHSLLAGIKPIYVLLKQKRIYIITYKNE
jgi:hypothetical protein